MCRDINAAKLKGHCFILQVDNDPKDTRDSYLIVYQEK